MRVDNIAALAMYRGCSLQETCPGQGVLILVCLDNPFLESWFLFKLRIEQNVFGCFQIVSEFLCSLRVLIGRAAASLQGRIQRAAVPSSAL